MNRCNTYMIEPNAPKKPTAVNIFGMVLQTIFAVVLYVVAVDMMCLLTTWLGGFMFEIGEGNTVIPLHSWRLVTFRAYWVVLGVAVVAALARKWIVLLTGERESDMCELLGAIEGAGAFASAVCAIVCLLGYAAAFDWWAGVTGKMASDSRANDYLLWAVVLTIGTIVEWRIVEGVLKALFPGEHKFHGLRFASVCVITPLLALVPTALVIIVCALVVGLFAGILFASLVIPVVIAAIGIAIAMSR